MKKAIALLLSTLLLGTSLAACGSTGSTDNSGTAPTDAPDTSSDAADAADDASDAADSGEVVTLKLGSTSPVGSVHETFATTFADTLKEVSGGKMQVEVNMGGVLGNTLSHYSQLEQGDLDFFMAALDTASGLREGADMAVVLVPFLFESKEHYKAFLESDLLAGMISKIEDANGLHFLGSLCPQLPRGLSTTNVPVHSVEDVRNLKIRMPEATAMTTVWSAWGANPTIISGGETYSALQSGLADGQDNDVLSTSTSAYYEIQKYYMELNYIYQDLFLWASAKNFAALTEEQQGWVEDAVAQTYDKMDAALDQMYVEEKQKMIDNGMEFIDVDLDSFRKATDAAVGEFEGTLYSAGLYEQIKALAG